MKVQVLTNNAGGLYTDELLQAESYEGPSKDGPCVPPLRLRARLRLRLCLRDRCSRRPLRSRVVSRVQHGRVPKGSRRADEIMR